jgi:hypothetical protein
MAAINERSTMVSVLCIALWSVTLPLGSRAQSPQPEVDSPAQIDDKAHLTDALAQLKSGHFLAAHVDLITQAGAVEAIPVLREQFAAVKDPRLKAKTAGALILLGDKDDAEWKYLVEFATPAVESDTPNFMIVSPEGKMLPGPSPEFITWAKAQNSDLQGLAQDAVYLLPSRIILLAWSRDPRAVPLLRKALLSTNYQIEIAAALGLAQIGDSSSVPFIVTACRKAPAEVASAMAEALIYFDDPEAQNAVDGFIPKDTAKMYRDARAQGRKRPWDN